ncbi:MAG: methylmalonyl Co-A mutase-associated GTPase MeaB [Blastocatellia bacterium]|nr:MAG: methylmalonyl Co-A mutase-associated GTPase MeaB [Blastocatellia bacterium]
MADRVLAGDPRGIARAISVVENNTAEGVNLMRAIFSRTGHAYLIGVTGAPGAGKSTLVDQLVGELRRRGSLVGILAVDPTSPFSGGAVLGDRLRMQAHANDDGVFIRSMATRGHLGGLARATDDAALVLDASGKDVVIIETVGVGQDEVDVVRTADVTMVMLVPGTGDEVQALKAGIMEIADIFVVNKADRDGSDRLVSAVEATLSLHAYAPDQWRPPIVKTIATRGQGIADVVDAIDQFRDFSRRSLSADIARPGADRDFDFLRKADVRQTTDASARRRIRIAQRVTDLVTGRFLEHLERRVLEPGELAELVDRIAAHETDPYTAADALFTRAAAPANVRDDAP